MGKKQRYIPASTPPHLRKLAQEGERVRFHGFRLGDTPRDRVVARWLDEQPNAAEAVKMLIYMVATGALSVGYPALYEGNDNQDRGAGGLASSLLSFDD